MKYKNNSQYLFSISEIVKTINSELKNNEKITTHAIRFWEKKFSKIKAKRLDGNRRLYDRNNLETIRLIRFLLRIKVYL